MKNEKYKYKIFGRFKGRKKIKNFNLESLYDYKINIKNDINRNQYNILDIGSGSGENAIHLSNTHPTSRIITCELFEDGNINLYNKIIINKIKNVLLFTGNVIEFLDLLNQGSIFNEIWILFPDPWIKIRHQKRRLINDNFIKFIHFFLKKNGTLNIASDSQSYNRSIIKLIYKYQNNIIFDDYSGYPLWSSYCHLSNFSCKKFWS